MPDSWTQQLDAVIEAQSAAMVAVRRHLHAHPETSGHEEATCRFVGSRLAEAGLAGRVVADGRGVIVDAPHEASRPRIALRADLDALPIQDAKRVDYCSQVAGVMHACGHDAHTAIALGTILALEAARGAGVLPWPVCWRGVFQPAEETNAGALQMVAAGAVEGVDAILALHVDPSRDVGTIGIREGVLTATCDEMEIRIEGRGGHAARPHESIDPIAAAAQLVSSIYLFVPRAIESHEAVVITIGQFLGGELPNVIPHHALLRGTMRTLDDRVSERNKDHIRQLAQGMAVATGTQIEVNFTTGPPAVRNNRALTRLLRETATDLLGAEPVEEIERPSMGGEDFAYFAERIPGCMFRLGCRGDGNDGVPLHAPQFDIDEKALTVGAKLLARAVVAWSDPKRRDKRGGP